VIVERLISLRERIVNEFCRAMEFKAFSDMAYQMASAQAKAIPSDKKKFIIGYSKFAHSLGLSDKTINAHELAVQLDHAKDEHLLSMVHQHQVALFEHLFFDILRLLLTDQPLHLPSKRQIEYSVIVAVQTKDEIITAMIERELNEVKYKNVGDWFDYLERLASGCRISDKELGQIAEAKATRDLLVHNAGIVNQVYLDKSGKFARSKIGEIISVGGDYTRDTWQLFSSALITIIDCLTKKFEANKSR
jgi:hypothetical protein